MSDPALPSGVEHIPRMGGQKQVVRIHASRIIAGVTDLAVGRDFPAKKKVGYTVGKLQPARKLHTTVLAVSECPYPLPALRRVVDFVLPYKPIQNPFRHQAILSGLVAELADAPASGAGAFTGVPVRLRPRPLTKPAVGDNP